MMISLPYTSFHDDLTTISEIINFHITIFMYSDIRPSQQLSGEIINFRL